MNAAVMRVDAAVLDVSGRLADRVREQLDQRVRTETPSLVVDRGGWVDRSVAVARPPRVTPAAGPSLSDLVTGVIVGCRPRLLLLLGPAASLRDSVAGSTALTAESVVQTAAGVDALSPEPTARGRSVIAQGVVETSSGDEDATTSWAYNAAEAATRAGQAFAVVAAVTRGPTLSGRVEPPAWREPTVARAAGRWVGSLMG
ncbi:MAG: hypothetical protein AAF805_10655, partial [Planctomycetota bacterium]